MMEAPAKGPTSGPKPQHGKSKRKRPSSSGSSGSASAAKKKDPLQAGGDMLPKPRKPKPKAPKHPLEKARDARARELYALDVGANPVSRVRDKKLKTKLRQTEGKYQKAALEAARSELLLPQEAGYLEPEGPLEQTWKLSQREVSGSSHRWRVVD